MWKILLRSKVLAVIFIKIDWEDHRESCAFSLKYAYVVGFFLLTSHSHSVVSRQHAACWGASFCGSCWDCWTPRLLLFCLRPLILMIFWIDAAGWCHWLLHWLQRNKLLQPRHSRQEQRPVSCWRNHKRSSHLQAIRNTLVEDPRTGHNSKACVVAKAVRHHCIVWNGMEVPHKACLLLKI